MVSTGYNRPPQFKTLKTSVLELPSSIYLTDAADELILISLGHSIGYKPLFKTGDLMQSFLDFLKEYKIVGLAVAVIIGSKVNDLVKAIVDNLIMPVVGLLTPSGNWRELTITVDQTKFGVGAVLGSTLDFIIVSLFIYLFYKFFLKEQKVTKK